MISKELLSEVLNKYVECVDKIYNSNLTYIERVSSCGMTPHGYMGIEESINIHELAHKCKEWAFKQGGYTITLDYNWLGIGGVIVQIKKNNMPLMEKQVTLETIGFPEEYIYIFEACQWILDKND